MAPNDVKLIATDLDDTILRRDNTVSDYAKSVFARCREKGILIAFATARSQTRTARIAEWIPPDILISDMGAIARQGAKVLYKATMPPDVVSELVQRVCNDPQILQISIQSDGASFDSEPWEGNPHSVLTDFSKPVEFGDVYKFTIRTADSQLPGIIAADFPGIGMISFRDTDWHAFHALGATKGNALLAVAAALGIPLGNIAAFGDDTSDIGMLRVAGIGVAMQNAIGEVKAAADCVCGDCDEDGAAHWIEENIL